MRYSPLLALCLLTLVAPARAGFEGWPRSDFRPAVDLDGTWQFRMDPDAVGETEKWFDASVPFPDRIEVPGCWDAQGFGEPGEKMFTNYVGKAWYRRVVRVPGSWEGKRTFLCVGGVHRYADVWVNGRWVKRHVGYVLPFEVDLTNDLAPGSDNTIAIRVDSAQDWSIDALTGAFDLIDYMDLSWGGIWRHVRLEARDAAYIESAFVQPKVSAGRVDVEVELRSLETLRRALVLEVIDPKGRVVAKGEWPVLVSAAGSVERASLDVPHPALWSPNHPALYRIRATLAADGRTADRWEDRFGMREIEIRGPDIYLNGQRLFLHGYGDDTIYPETIVPPAEHATHRERFARVKEFGLNYVRHHSTVPPAEYFDVADEVGVLVQPELPIAYQPFLDRGLQSERATQLYVETWEGMIRHLRNHPSAFAWCMGNEMWDGLVLGPKLYETAKRLDPTRPVYDTDGAPLAAEARPTLDINTVMFDVWALPVLGNARKYEIAEPPLKPIISHEMGNFSSYPDLSDAANFRKGIRPFWLEQSREQLRAQGLLQEAPRWLETSAALQAACFKIETEAARWSPYVDGHALWLFQDYWTGSSGLINYHGRVKGPGAEYCRQFLADTVLLARLPDECFEAGVEVRVPVAISDFGEADLTGRTIEWALLGAGDRQLARGTLEPLSGAKGLTHVGEATFTTPPVEWAGKLRFRLTLGTGRERARNEWPLWVFPHTAVPKPIPGVQIVRRLHEDALAWIEDGGRAILTRPEALLPSEPVTFEGAWWRGSPGGDSHVGTVVYDTPAMRDFPHEGWCDLQFLRLQHNRPALLLDGLPLRKGTLIRAIDCHMGNRDKALMVEARIGKGSVLLTTLDLSPAALRERPEARWLLRGLIDYVAVERFRPVCELDPALLRSRIVASPQLGPVARVEGFARLAAHVGDTTEEARYRLSNPRAYVVRGTDGTHVLEWETAPVPAAASEETVCFAFSGGLGWATEPEAPFTLRVGDLAPVVFEVAPGGGEWLSADGRVRLVYEPRTVFEPDSLGVFYLLAPRAALAPGQPARIRVETSASQSKRWLLVHPATAVWAE